MKVFAVRLFTALVTFAAGTLADFALRPTPPVFDNAPPSSARFEAPPAEAPVCGAMLSGYLYGQKASAWERTRQADALTERECYKEAVVLLQDAVRLEPSYAEAYEDLGYLYNSLSRFEEAREVLERRLRLREGDAFTHVELAYTLNETGHPSEAVEALTRAVALEPSNAYARASFSDSYLQLELRGRAAEMARMAVKLAPYERDDAALDNAALTLKELGHLEEAQAAVRQALTFEPENLYAHYTLAEIQALRGLQRDAEASFRRVLGAQTDTPYEHLLRAWAHMNLGDADAAASEARCYILLADWKGRNAPYAGLLAHLAYRRAGRLAESEAVLHETSENADPSGWPAQIIKTLRGELPEEVLFSQAQDNSELTAARGLIGLRHAIDGRTAPALAHLEWVREHGDRRFAGYAFALGRLNQLEASAPRTRTSE